MTRTGTGRELTGVGVYFHELKEILLNHLSHLGLDDETAYYHGMHIFGKYHEIRAIQSAASYGYQALRDIHQLSKAEEYLDKIDSIFKNLENPLKNSSPNHLSKSMKRIRNSIEITKSHRREVASIYNAVVEDEAAKNGLGPPKRGRGRPENRQANAVAIEVATLLRLVTQKDVSITKDPYVDRDVRTGLFIDLLKDIFDSLGLGSSPVVSAAEYAVTRQRTQK